MLTRYKVLRELDEAEKQLPSGPRWVFHTCGDHNDDHGDIYCGADEMASVSHETCEQTWAIGHGLCVLRNNTRHVLSALALYMKAVDEAPHTAYCWVWNEYSSKECTCWKGELESQVAALLNTVEGENGSQAP